MIPVSVSGLLISEETEERMKEIDPRDPLLHWNMFDTMVKYYNPDGNLPQYILGKADEDDYTGFPKIIMKILYPLRREGLPNQDQGRNVSRMAGLHIYKRRQGW